ncbi:MAG TPA: hypothetical protein VMV95_00860 [Bacillota bacterium]|nr:hypothetical protein [Bacillota bacterium]
MKKETILLVLLMSVLVLFPLTSATLIINQQPAEVYNLGDVISVPVKVVSTGEMLGSLNIDLICGTQKVNYKVGIPLLSVGEEYETNLYIPLIKSEIGELKERCKMRVSLGADSVLTKEFKISDLILMDANLSILEFDPGETLFINGQAIRENGAPANGFIELSILEGNNSILNHLETVKNGVFSINTILPNKIKAGALILNLNLYEIDSDGKITNKGFLNQNIRINQIPTSLEIVFESKEVIPGTNLKIKSVLYDQTGEKIPSIAKITLKNRNDKIMEQTEIATEEFLEFPILYNEFPSKWKVIASSNELTSESLFTILEKESISIEIINKTLTIANTGNVLYNKTALIKIGNKTLNIDLYLEVDESQKYIITAPDGEYNVKVITGDTDFSGQVALTGKTIDVKKAPGKIGSIIKYPLIWIFIILILGFVVFITFRRGSKKTFVGHISSKIRKGGEKGKLIPLVKGSLVNSRNKAELSLSIKGDKQNVSLVALNIKNLKEIQAKKSNVEETLQKIVNLSEENKAVTYESNNDLFFILAPTKTRTFKNEKMALEIANKIKEILSNHNKMAKQKINFGISLNYGTIVAKQEKDSFKFMSLGTLMAATKKIASLAEENILLSEKMNDVFGSSVKTTKHEKSGMDVYSIKEIRNVEEHKKFIRNFLDRIERDKK